MKNPLLYIYNAVRSIAIRTRYIGKCDVGLVQSFENMHIKIENAGRLKIGNYNQSRGYGYIGVHSGTLIIGDHCFFNINSSITCVESIKIGNNCKFGNNLVIVDHDHNFRGTEPEFVSSPICIGNNVWCGANVVILKGTKIGDNCVIGAGTIVDEEVPNNTILVSKKDNIIRNIERR